MLDVGNSKGKKNDSRKKIPLNICKNLFSAQKMVFVFHFGLHDRHGKYVFFMSEIHITAVSEAEVNPLKNLFHGLGTQSVLMKMNHKLSLIHHHGILAH